MLTSCSRSTREMAARTDAASASAAPDFARPDDKKDVVREILRHRHVDLNELRGLIRASLHLARDANDLANDRFGFRRRGRPQRHALADR